MIPPIANRFVAGESTAAAIEHTETVNERGVGALLNRLGEHYDDPADAATDRDAYLALVRQIDDSGVNAAISVKPSQIGLLIGAETFRDNLREIVDEADAHDVFVWLDMEDHETTDPTLDAYLDFAREFENGVGVCLQSNLKRTSDDLRRVRDVPGRIRLVKGAYDEPRKLAYTRQSRVDERYRLDLRYAFSSFDTGAGIAVASHDPGMIEYAIELAETYDRDFEFQMLMGVREDEQERLARKGYEVNQYVPYGEKWASYFSRRIRERKENALFAIRALFG